jgi:hypothetical protein
MLCSNVETVRPAFCVIVASSVYMELHCMAIEFSDGMAQNGLASHYLSFNLVQRFVARHLPNAWSFVIVNCSNLQVMQPIPMFLQLTHLSVARLDCASTISRCCRTLVLFKAFTTGRAQLIEQDGFCFTKSFLLILKTLLSGSTPFFLIMSCRYLLCAMFFNLIHALSKHFQFGFSGSQLGSPIQSWQLA